MKRHTGKGRKLNTSQAEPVAANSRAVGQIFSISCEAYILLTRYSPGILSIDVALVLVYISYATFNTGKVLSFLGHASHKLCALNNLQTNKSYHQGEQKSSAQVWESVVVHIICCTPGLFALLSER